MYIYLFCSVWEFIHIYVYTRVYVNINVFCLALHREFCQCNTRSVPTKLKKRKMLFTNDLFIVKWLLPVGRPVESSRVECAQQINTSLRYIFAIIHVLYIFDLFVYAYVYVCMYVFTSDIFLAINCCFYAHLCIHLRGD